MAVTDVYKQYFEADCTVSGVLRRGAAVTLTATSEEGNIKYEAGVSFFPHRDEEDFAVSYDAFFSRVLYDARGRRSKKREKLLLEELRAVIDDISSKADGRVFWDRPLREATFG